MVQQSKRQSKLNSFLCELLGGCCEFEIERYEMPNFLALNFVVKGFLSEGLAASINMDPQAKTLGEYLRVKKIATPESITES